MFSRILVPLDGRSASETVIPSALEFARSVGAEVVLCHVITGPLAANASAQPRYAVEYLRDVAQLFLAAGISCKTQVRRGDPAIEIKTIALDWSVDAIVMATRSRRKVEKFVLGSVADAVVRDSHLPVLLVSSRKQPLKAKAA